MNGAEALCAALRELGADCVFGLPGTQNTPLYEALRVTGLRPIVPSDEGAAAFMAVGYARAAGGVSVLTTIPGPGFLYALPGIAEAREDSAAVLWITLRARRGGQAFPLQVIDQPAIAAPLVKAVHVVEQAGEVDAACRRAWQLALSEEPGPVMLELAEDVLLQDVVGPLPAVSSVGASKVAADDIAALVQRLRCSTHPLIIAGQGAQGAAEEVRALAHRFGAPVLVTCSGRGTVLDEDELAFVQDFSQGLGEVIPEMLAAADLILVLGCKFTHNGSAGGTLELSADKLVRIDASKSVLAANYPASLCVHAHCEDVVHLLTKEISKPAAWDRGALRSWRDRLAAQRSVPIRHEPQLVRAAASGTVRADHEDRIAALFDALAASLGAAAIYTTDAGLHQLLTRRYVRVVRSRGLLCPSDFQSMGFGLPGAIGAGLAKPDAHVIACIGDGGFALSAGDLATAARLGIRLTVIVFNDRSFGLIRRQQIANYGHSSGVDFTNMDYERIAAGMGCGYLKATDDSNGFDGIARKMAAGDGVTLIELPLEDSPTFSDLEKRAQLRARLRRVVPEGLRRHAKRLLGR